MKICLFGGTFNPIHLGHINMAKEAIKVLSLDRVDFIPSGESYFKTGVLAAKDRYYMTELCVRDCFDIDDNVFVSDIEIKREGPSYSYETVLEYKEKYPEDTLFFLIGEDTLYSISMWKNPEIIFKNCILVVARRQGGEEERFYKTIDELKKTYGAIIESIPYDFPVSSTIIRRDWWDKKDIGNWVSTSVARYIYDNSLYRK